MMSRVEAVTTRGPIAKSDRRNGDTIKAGRRAAASRRDDESVVNESGAHSTADRLLTVQRRAVHQALAVERIVVGTVHGAGVVPDQQVADLPFMTRSEEHTSELQSLMRISY